jgi:hypothetical protein
MLAPVDHLVCDILNVTAWTSAGANSPPKSQRNPPRPAMAQPTPNLTAPAGANNVPHPK